MFFIFSSKSLNPLSEYINVAKIGYIFRTNQTCVAKVIDVISCNKILIEFQDENKYKKYVTNSEIKSGSISNPYYKSVCGVGYIGEEIKNTDNSKYDKCKNTWSSIIRRGYDEYTKNKRPMYRTCTVCEEWHNYQNFKKWYYNNYYEIEKEVMCLDKDILLKGNKSYSPEMCIFVPNRINVLFTKSDSARGSLPIGVHRSNNSFSASCSEIQSNGKKAQTHLGTFKTPEEAFYMYKTYKENVIKQVADKYKEVIPNKLYEALYKWEVEIND